MRREAHRSARVSRVDAIAAVEQNAVVREFSPKMGRGVLVSHRQRGWTVAPLCLALCLALAGCSSQPSSDAEVRSKLRLTRPEWNVSPVSAAVPRGVTADDLVAPDGRCAGDPAPAETGTRPGALNFQAGPEVPSARPAATPAPSAEPSGRGGIALEMTECDVIRAAGHTDQVEISANERGERSVILSYLQGPHPGIYRFVSGRLKSIERAPVPDVPVAAKPSGKKPAKKPVPN
jgi:hypothetical protein